MEVELFSLTEPGDLVAPLRVIDEMVRPLASQDPA